MPALSVLVKPASGLCNMHCDYCFYLDETANRCQPSYGFMTDETLKNVIRRTILRADRQITYAFQGGEPTLCGIEFFERVLFYQKKYKPNGLMLQNVLQTNASLINDDWARLLKENHFLVGVSFDGTPPLHDTFRHFSGKHSASDMTLQGIAHLEKHGVDFNILTVVNKETAKSAKDIYASYKKRGWHYQQYIPCLDELGVRNGNTPYSLTPDLLGHFLVELFDEWYEDWKKNTQPYIRQFENWIGIMLGIQPEACDQRGICSVQYVVEADGSVFPCDFYVLDEYKLGNFNTDRIDVIDEARRKNKFTEAADLPVKCKECRYHTLCRGGCKRNRVAAESGILQNIFCEGFLFFFDSRCNKIKEVSEDIKKRRE